MIGFNPNQFYIIFCNEFAEQIKQSRVPHLGLADKRERETNRKLHTLTHQINKRAGSWVVAVLRHLSKVAFIHLLIKKTMRNMFNRSSTRNGLCRELQSSWLMHHGINS